MLVVCGGGEKYLGHLSTGRPGDQVESTSGKQLSGGWTSFSFCDRHRSHLRCLIHGELKACAIQAADGPRLRIPRLHHQPHGPHAWEQPSRRRRESTVGWAKKGSNRWTKGIVFRSYTSLTARKGVYSGVGQNCRVPIHLYRPSSPLCSGNTEQFRPLSDSVGKKGHNETTIRSRIPVSSHRILQ